MSFGMKSERSMTKIRKRVGLKTPPWGTPLGMGTGELRTPLWVTLVERLVK
jgi:hypothetical protein